MYRVSDHVRFPLSDLHGVCVRESRLDRESDMAALLEATRPALKDVLGKVYSMSRDQVWIPPLTFGRDLRPRNSCAVLYKATEIHQFLYPSSLVVDGQNNIAYIYLILRVV